MRTKPAHTSPTVSGLRPSTPATHPNMGVAVLLEYRVCIYKKLKE